MKLPDIRLPKRLRTTVRKDRIILAICLVIASIFWFFNKMSKTYTAERTYRLEYELREDEVFTDLPPEELTVTLRGRGWDLLNNLFQGDERMITLSPEGYGGGLINESQLRARLIATIDRNLDLLRIDQEFIYINVEQAYEMRLPIHPRFELEFAEEHHLADLIQLSPDSVTLMGPASKMTELARYPTVPLRLKNLSDSYRGRVALVNPPVPQMTLDTTTTEVFIPVERFVEKTFFVPVTVRNAPVDTLTTFPVNVQLTATVGLQHFDSVQTQDFTIYADLAGVAPDGNNNTAPLMLENRPHGVRSVSFFPRSVEFLFGNKRDSEAGPTNE